MVSRKKHIYLDTAAATALDSRVLTAMRPFLTKSFANPSSLHVDGTTARQAVENSRQKIAQVIEASAQEIIFTSGGTEANNLAILGLTHQFVRDHKRPGHIITSVIEHSSVLEPCRQLERAGWSVTYLPVDPDGLTDLKTLAQTLRPETVLVSIGYANNEIGTIQPICKIAKVIRCFKKLQANEANLYPIFHTDACQSPRFLDCLVSTLGVDLMTFSSGKIYGPKGVGCLYARRGLKLAPIILGGGQERGLRSGTENVAGVVGFAAALKLCSKLRIKESRQLTKLRDYFIGQLIRLSAVILNGSPKSRLPNNINFSFIGIDSEFVVLNLDAADVAASTGSACSVYGKGESHVVMALGRTSNEITGAVRFTLGRDTTKADLDYVLKILPAILKRARISL